MKHVHKAVLLFALAAMLLQCGVPAIAADTPSLPAIYWGSVTTTGGSPVASGVVEAVVDGNVCGSLDIVDGRYGNPPPGRGLVVQGEGGSDLNGKTVRFRVKGVFAAETVTWQSRDAREVDLTFDLQDDPGGGGSPGGGGGGSSGDDDNPEQPSPAISDSVIDSAIEQASRTGKVTVEAPAGQHQLVLSIKQFRDILATGKPLETKNNDVTMLFEPKALELPELNAGNISRVQFTATPLPVSEVQEAIAQANRGGLFKIAGEVFELSLGVVLEDGRETLIQQFNGKVRVTLPVPQTAVEQAAGRLTVGYYDEETKTWQDVGGEYDPDTGTITFETNHFSKFAVMEIKALEKVVFNDITGHWARADIEFMAARGFVGGVGNDMFAPEAKITRAQFAAFLVRILDVPEFTGDLHFADVKAGDWYYSPLAAAYQSGLVKGISEDRVAPNDYITREQMAVMLVRAMEYKGQVIPTAKELTFTDKGDISDWAAAGISQSAQMNLTGGFPDGTFKPRANATRAEAVVMLHRVYNRIQ